MSSLMAEIVIYSLVQLALSLVIMGAVYWFFHALKWTTRTFSVGSRQVTRYLGTSVHLIDADNSPR